MPTTMARAANPIRRSMCWPVRRAPRGRAMTRLVAVSDWTTTSGAAVEGGGLEDPSRPLGGGPGQPHRTAKDLDQEPRIVLGGGRFEGALLLEHGAQGERQGGQQPEEDNHYGSARAGLMAAPGPATATSPHPLWAISSGLGQRTGVVRVGP